MHDPVHILETIDDALKLVGGLVLLIAGGTWWLTGRRDPLRKSPIRRNDIWPIVLWMCLLSYLLIATVALQLALWIAPNTEASVTGGQNGEMSILQRLLATTLMQLLLIAAGLIAAPHLFVNGLHGLGWQTGNLLKSFIYTVGGLLASLCVCGVILDLTDLIVNWLHFLPPTHAVLTLLSDPQAPAWMRWSAIGGAVILAPLAEEILYRGYVQTGMRRLFPPRSHSYYHRWLAIVATSIMFGAMHSPVPHHIPALIAFSVVLGFLYERTGSLMIPIAVHMLFNAKSILWHSILLPWSLVYQLQGWLSLLASAGS